MDITIKFIMHTADGPKLVDKECWGLGAKRTHFKKHKTEGPRRPPPVGIGLKENLIFRNLSLNSSILIQ